MDNISRSYGFNLAALALILLMGGLGLAYWLISFGPKEENSIASIFAPPLVSKIVANTKMQIPAQWLNSLTKNNQENVQALDLTLAIKLSPQAELANINLRLAPFGQAQSSSYLLDSVYVPRFSSQQINTIRGLVGKPLKPQDGYENETIWYQPVASTPFVAKCIDLEISATTLNCLRTIALGSQLSLTYQFSEVQLQYWSQMDSAIAPLLKQIGALE